MGISVDSGRPDKGPTPEINVTPLVDVVLVLLIIFMIVTPQLENDVQVDLPAIFNVDPDVQKNVDPLEIAVSRDGAWWVDKQPVERESLEAMLREMRTAEPTRRVNIKADRELGFGKARDVFEVVRASGYPGAALLVGERAPERSGEIRAEEPVGAP